MVPSTTSPVWIFTVLVFGCALAELPVQSSGYNYPKPNIKFNPTGQTGFSTFGGYQQQQYQTYPGHGSFGHGGNYQQYPGNYIGGAVQNYNNLGTFGVGANYKTVPGYVNNQFGYQTKAITGVASGYNYPTPTVNFQTGVYQQQQFGGVRGIQGALGGVGYTGFQQKGYVKPEYGVPGVNYKV